MKTLITLVLSLLLPLGASAHPGKTNRCGGHVCLKECEEWNLFYKEYHLHDKDGKPVRVVKNKHVKREPVIAEMTTGPTETALLVNPATSTTATSVPRVASVVAESLFPFNMLLIVLAALLVLLLVIRMNRRREEG